MYLHAEQSPGVHAVITHENAPAQGARDEPSPAPWWRARPTLASPHIGHYGESVALVVAATLEQAQAAANLVHIAYAAEPGHFDFMANAERAYAPKQLIFGLPTDSAVGDFECGVRKRCRSRSTSTTARRIAFPNPWSRMRA